MKAGDKIRVAHYHGECLLEYTDHIVEEFRFCLGIFLSSAHREAGHFTPLCELYEPGPDSEKSYVPNHGEYHTNMVPAWMDLPRDNDAAA